MTTQVQLLKNDAVRADIKLSELLRRTKIIAKEVESNDFLQWIEKELNGYSESDKVPTYRIVKGEPRGWNPYQGWIPWIIENPEKQRKISQRGAMQSIGELEQLIAGKSENSNLQMPYPEKLQRQASKSVGFLTKFTLLLPQNAIVGILEVVRNKLIGGIVDIDKKYKETMLNVQSNKDMIFPNELIKKLPQDLKILADDFNFNFSNGRPIVSMLTLRRMLPLAIVRKFQQLDREAEIKNKNGEYLETKALLGKTESLLSNKRTYKELLNYKILIDSSQHSYILNIQMPDTEGASLKIRVFLDDIF